jgi:predicted ATPase
MKNVGRSNFDSDKFEIAPWTKLNNLFAKLKLEYRFKSNYEIFGVEITEQPKLFALQSDGTLDENNWRNLFDLSDGEKAIISLCFASLSGSNLTVKKLLLLDEYDAVLNPSLVQIFFTVIKDFFVDKGVLVIMATHSPATISLAPEYAKYYEIFKPNQDGSRILEVSKDDYAELRIANKSFYDKIENQSKRIKELEGTIQSDEDVLIITEGKTDWKYILSALRYFHSKDEFSEIEERFFYKFGSEDDVANSVCDTEYFNDLSDSKLKNFLQSSLDTRKIDSQNISQIRIGIFDSDNKDIKVVIDELRGIYSFKIDPLDISTEFLFLDEEIKTLVDDRRLYIGDEFHERSKRHIADTSLTLGDGSQNTNKAGKRTIIESGVYDSIHQNIALSKEKFAQAIYENKVTISEGSWEKFRHIFDNIQKCLPIKAEKAEPVAELHQS